jgi:hypothetical protein
MWSINSASTVVLRTDIGHMSRDPQNYSGTSGAELMRLSWQYLRKDRELLAIPILSALAVNATSFSILGLLWATGRLPGLMMPTPDGHTPTTAYLLGFIVVYATTFVAVFFQVALCSGAMTRLDGGNPSLRSCFAVALARLPQIAMWSLVSASVGMVLRVISERVGILGRFVAAGLSLAWAVATLFVVPVIVVEHDGSISAVSRSAALVKARWKNVGSAGLRFGWSFLLLPITICASAVALGVGLAWRYQAPLFLIVAAFGIIGFLAVAVVASATGMYLRVVLYRYAAGLPVPGIPRGMLAHALPGGAELHNTAGPIPRPQPEELPQTPPRSGPETPAVS